MSLIASFYTIGADRRGELVAAFRPIEVRTARRWQIFRRKTSETRYPWYDYLRRHAREEFDLMLSRVSASMFDLGLPESTDLSTYSQASVALFDHPRATTAIANLESLGLTAADISRFYDSDSRPEIERCDLASLLAARQELILWCRTVSRERLGLLIVG